MIIFLFRVVTCWAFSTSPTPEKWQNINDLSFCEHVFKIYRNFNILMVLLLLLWLLLLLIFLQLNEKCEIIALPTTNEIKFSQHNVTKRLGCRMHYIYHQLGCSEERLYASRRRTYLATQHQQPFHLIGLACWWCNSYINLFKIKGNWWHFNCRYYIIFSSFHFSFNSYKSNAINAN